MLVTWFAYGPGVVFPSEILLGGKTPVDLAEKLLLAKLIQLIVELQQQKGPT